MHGVLAESFMSHLLQPYVVRICVQGITVLELRESFQVVLARVELLERVISDPDARSNSAHCFVSKLLQLTICVFPRG